MGKHHKCGFVYSGSVKMTMAMIKCAYALVVLLALASCNSAPLTVAVREIPFSVWEGWNLNGTNYMVKTSCLITDTGHAFLCLKATCNFDLVESGRPVALAIARYAVTNGYASQALQNVATNRPRELSGYEVLLEQNITLASNNTVRGRQYNFTTSEIIGTDDGRVKGTGSDGENP